MARRRGTDRSENISMRPLNRELQEDEYGYVDPTENDSDEPEMLEEPEPLPIDRTSRRVARNVMMQLPSRNIDDLLTTREPTDTATDGATLRLGLPRRSDSVYRSVRLKSALLNGQHMNADEIYQVLTKEGEMSPEEMRNTLKEMRQTLSTKRDLKRLLDRDEEIRRQSRGVGWATRMKYRLGMKWQHLKYDLRDLTYSLELWHRHVKVIQGQFGTGVASYFKFLRWLLYLNIFNFIIMLGFVVVPQWIYNTASSYHGNATYTFSSSDLLTGSGWFSHSVLYYGAYTNNTINVLWSLEYDMPLSYLLTFGVFAVINLVIVAFCLAKSYQQNYIGTFGELRSVFVNKVFCAWDYSIETKNAASLQKRSIFNDVKETLSAELEIEIEQSTRRKVLNGSICLFLNILVLSFISGVGALVHMILEHSGIPVEIPLLQKMVLSIAITVMAFMSYQVFHLVGRFEFFFSKVTRLYLTMGRTVLLKLVMLGVVVRFWMFVHVPNSGMGVCYETDIGQEIYRLILVNFIFTFIFCTIVGEMLRKCLYSSILKWVGHPEFDIAYNTLDIIYYQTLLWLGIFFSPLLPILVLVVYVLQFYIKRYSVSMNCIPSEKPWCASHTQTVFLGLAFLNFIFCIVAVGYNIWRMTPSDSCGPFQSVSKRYGIITSLFPSAGEEHVILSAVIEYGTSAGVIAAVITALCVLVYYVRAQSLGHSNMVRLIHEQLVLEGKDKVFLLKLFNEALQHKNGSGLLSAPGTSGLAAGRGSSSTPEKISNGKWCEIVNEVYKDYYHGISPAPPASRNAFAGKYDPGYMPAAVPTNNISPDYSDSDSISSLENIRRDNPRPSVGSASCDSDSDRKSYRMPRALSPKSRSSSEVMHTSQGDIHSPTTKGTRRSADPFPRPVHQPAFQYLARGETPPKISRASNNSIPSKKGKN